MQIHSLHKAARHFCVPGFLMHSFSKMSDTYHGKEG